MSQRLFCQRTLICWAFSSVALAPQLAGANVGAAYGAGSDALGRAGQAIATPRSDAAALHNVAALAWATTRARVGGLGVGHTLAVATRCSGAACLPPRRPRRAVSIAAGWAAPVTRRVGLGVTLSTPVGDLVRVRATDPRRPHWPLLAAPAEQFALLAAVGVQLTSWLALGVGAEVRAGIGSTVRMDVAPLNQRIERADVAIELGPSVTATLGLLARLSARWRAGLTYHQQAGVPYAIPASIVVRELSVVRLRLAQLAHAAPHTFSLGVAHIWGSLELEAGLRWRLWRRLDGLGPDLSLQTGGPAVDGLGLNGAARIEAPARAWAPALRDTVSPALSARWRAHRQLQLTAGWRFAPTPLPPATDAAALLGTDAQVLAAGLQLRLQGWTLAAAGQLWLRATRRVASGPVASYGGSSTVASFDITRRF